MPAKIVLAGKNTYKIYIRESLKAYDNADCRHTRLTPPEIAAEDAHNTFTVGLNHLVNLSSPL